jgi:FkbM family methyltransferase
MHTGKFTLLKGLLRFVMSWSPGAQVSYAQEGEDLLLARTFLGQPTGYYVDVGAHHPTRFSNTYWAYRLGWIDLAIDPAPAFRNEFLKKRPRDVACQVAVAEHNGEQTLFVFEESALNTSNLSRLASVEASTAFSSRQVSVQALPMSMISDLNVPPNQVIDLMSIDIEGSESLALRGIDWEKHKPRVLVVEVLNHAFGNMRDWPELKELEKIGFVPVSYWYHSLILVSDPDLLRINWNVSSEIRDPAE